MLKVMKCLLKPLLPALLKRWARFWELKFIFSRSNFFEFHFGGEIQMLCNEIKFHAFIHIRTSTDIDVKQTAEKDCFVKTHWLWGILFLTSERFFPATRVDWKIIDESFGRAIFPQKLVFSWATLHVSLAFTRWTLGLFMSRQTFVKHFDWFSGWFCNVRRARLSRTVC